MRLLKGLDGSGNRNRGVPLNLQPLLGEAESRTKPTDLSDEGTCQEPATALQENSTGEHPLTFPAFLIQSNIKVHTDPVGMEKWQVLFCIFVIFPPF